jgi:zinc/manganese transport system substrate-binding protein
METVIVIDVLIPSARRMAAALLIASPFTLIACGSDGANTTSASAPSDAPPCPVTPVEVVTSVDQWGQIVSTLGGACADVTTLLASSSVDPHSYEPSPADAAEFGDAQLIVINGGHYDEWAAKLAASSAAGVPVVDAVELAGHDQHEHDAEHDHEAHDHEAHDDEAHDHGAHEGHDHEAHNHGAENAHVWYDPAAVVAVADAVTTELKKLAPQAADYFTQRRSVLADAMAPYNETIASIRTSAAGKTYAATESVFDPMAAALGLQNKTPQGYQTASNNETDPSPADLDAFLRLLRDKGVDVLIYNSQTQGSVPEQIRSAAEQAGVPVVEVTETVAPGTDSFEAWQVDQLTALAKALGVDA